MTKKGFDDMSQSFTLFWKFGFNFTTVIPIVFKDQEVTFKT